MKKQKNKAARKYYRQAKREIPLCFFIGTFPIRRQSKDVARPNIRKQAKRRQGQHQNIEHTNDDVRQQNGENRDDVL